MSFQLYSQTRTIACCECKKSFETNRYNVVACPPCQKERIRRSMQAASKRQVERKKADAAKLRINSGATGE